MIIPLAPNELDEFNQSQDSNEDQEVDVMSFAPMNNVSNRKDNLDQVSNGNKPKVSGAQIVDTAAAAQNQKALIRKNLHAYLEEDQCSLQFEKAVAKQRQESGFFDESSEESDGGGFNTRSSKLYVIKSPSPRGG